MDGQTTVEIVEAEPIPQELKCLQGMWISAAGRRPLQFHIDGQNFVVRFRDGDVYTGWLDVGTDEWPRTMVMSIADGPVKHKGKTALCIYQWEGERFRWCPAEPGNDDPPAEFPEIEDTRFICTIFERDTAPPKKG